MRSHDVATANAWVLTMLPALLVGVMTTLLTPLALVVAAVPRWLRRAAVPAGALAAAGLVLVELPGALATLTVVPYAIVAVIAGVLGAQRLVRARTPSAIALAVALVFVPAATSWLVAERCGYALLGYAPFWVLLTSAHFHVAGIYLLTVVGRVTHDRGRVAGAIAIACTLAIPLTAAGIYGPSWLEVSAALAMAVSAFAAGIVLVTTRRLGLRVAGAILLVSMPLAAAFALRDHGTSVTIFGFEPLGSMLASHGALNVVFAIVALATLARTAPRSQPHP